MVVHTCTCFSLGKRHAMVVVTHPGSLSDQWQAPVPWIFPCNCCPTSLVLPKPPSAHCNLFQSTLPAQVLIKYSICRSHISCFFNASVLSAMTCWCLSSEAHSLAFTLLNISSLKSCRFESTEVSVQSWYSVRMHDEGISRENLS